MIVRIDIHQIYLRELKVVINILLYIGIVNESRTIMMIHSFYTTISFCYFASGAGEECSAFDLRAASKI